MQLIVGLKGTGKTKALIDEVNRASRESDGVVICVEYGRKLTFDIKYHARLVDAKEYGINDAQKLYGFLCGMLACNYDITDLFIDSALKICGGDIKAFEEFLAAADRITADHNINCVITASVEAESLSEQARAFVRGI
ncbi:MAG: hypothetical protein IJQ53_00985 [Clostridia bacterium]|nr:hypothetical protein [Clostridia bacterium]